MTWIFTPEMPRDLASEDVAFKAYLEANGWDTSAWGGGAIVESNTSQRSIEVDEKEMSTE